MPGNVVCAYLPGAPTPIAPTQQGSGGASLAAVFALQANEDDEVANMLAMMLALD
jgi:hypothetical protein